MVESCEMFPNYTKSDYKRYSKLPLEQRLDVGSTYADLTLAPYWERHTGGDGKHPTPAERARLERLADYILADDHVKGYMTIRDPYEELDAISACYPPGEGAIEFMRKHDVIFYCIADAEPYADGKHTKLCGVCGYVFEDFTRPKNKKYCGTSCVKIHEARALRIRKHGSASYEGERNRMSAEYPFYSPVEMRLLEERSEVSHGGYDKLERLYSAKERKKTMGGHKNEVKLVDVMGTPGQKYLDGQYGWVSNRNSGRKSVKNDNSPIWWGEVVTYNIKEQPLNEKFREAKFSSRVLRQRWEGNSSSFPYIFYSNSDIKTIKGVKVIVNGFAVKAIRLSKELTQTDFGESIGYSQSYIAEIEAGRKLVTDDVRIRIAQVYGTGDDIKEAITRAKESVNLAL